MDVVLLNDHIYGTLWHLNIWITKILNKKPFPWTMHRNRCAFCRFLALSGIQLEVKIMSWQQYATMIIMIKIRNNDQPDNNSHLEKFGETTANSRSYQIWGFLELGTPKKNIAFRIRPKNGQEFRSHKKMIIFSVPRWIDHSRYGNQTCWPLDNPPQKNKEVSNP